MILLFLLWREGFSVRRLPAILGTFILHLFKMCTMINSETKLTLSHIKCILGDKGNITNYPLGGNMDIRGKNTNMTMF